tara:strand:- start:1355 stop:1843 length:489 start_codon:yes stop_codon:yes gene_type:complete
MDRNLIFYYVILGMLSIGSIISYYYKKYSLSYLLGIFVFLFFTLIFMYMWREDYNVHPNNKDNNYRNKVLWINVDKLDVLNKGHNIWAKNLLIRHAPNKLGIYCDKYNVTTLDVLRYREIFYELFGYNTEDIYFKNAKLTNKVKNFCKDKNLRIQRISFRIN